MENILKNLEKLSPEQIQSLAVIAEKLSETKLPPAISAESESPTEEISPEPVSLKLYKITMKSGRVFFYHTDIDSCLNFSNTIAAEDKNINVVVRFATFFDPKGHFSLNVAEIESIEEIVDEFEEIMVAAEG